MSEEYMWLILAIGFGMLAIFTTTGPAFAGSLAGLGCSLANYFLCWCEDERGRYL